MLPDNQAGWQAPPGTVAGHRPRASHPDDSTEELQACSAKDLEVPA